MFNSNLTQLVSCPTHVKGNILDLILTSNEESIFDLKVHESPVKTDHLMLSFHLYINMIKCHSRKSTVVFDYKRLIGEVCVIIYLIVISVLAMAHKMWN